MTKITYQEQKFNLQGLRGLSERQVSEHLKLYSGYVKNVNALTEQMDFIISKDPNQFALGLSELRRRLGFEFNGMRLHEYYFGELGGASGSASQLKAALANQYGSFENWWADFVRVGLMRGSGWAILYYDSTAKGFHNVWVSDHELGHLAGLPIVLAMDVWEHAYLFDYLPAQKKDYIQAFFENLNWSVLEERFIMSKKI